MKTALLLALPEHGHLPACLPLAAELGRRGVRVVVYGTAGFRDAIAAAGAEFRDYGAAVAPAPAHTGGLYSVMAYIGGLTEAVLPGLLADIAALRPDLLLVDAMCLWGQLAHQATGIPAVTLAPVFVPHPEHVSDEDLLNQAYAAADTPALLDALDALNTYFQQTQRLDRRFGVDPPGLAAFFAGRQALNLVFTARSFHPAGEAYGEDYAFVGPQWAPGAPPGIAEIAAELPAGPQPLVYISLGTIFHQDPEFYAACRTAFGGPDHRVALALGDPAARAAVEPVPAGWRVARRWPQRAVLAHASVFVTHAGMNSATEALWQGIPLVCVPRHGDQFLVAEQVARAGAGLVLPPGRRSADDLRQAVERVLHEESWARSARAVGDALRAAAGPAGGAARAADLVLAHARARRGAGA